jgi:Cu(I)/Ag(I) efflux system membrane fusion protein
MSSREPGDAQYAGERDCAGDVRLISDFGELSRAASSVEPESLTDNPASTANRPPSWWQKFRMVAKVVELRLRFITLMVATGLVFAYWDTIWNYYDKWSRPAGEPIAAAADVEYYCPMHPSVVRDDPGNCPICGMPLSKRKKGQKEELPEGVTARVQLSPFRVAQAGIRTAEITYEPLVETVTAVGFVTFDERRLSRISSKTKGLARVEKLFVNFTGKVVEQGQPLAELYSPELYQATRELLMAQSVANVRGDVQSATTQTLLGNSDNLVALARDKLALWGITPDQIDEILAKGKADYRLKVLAPISGVVVRKNIVEGSYVGEGEPMFEIADLGHVWVQAKIYEDQLDRVRMGQEVEASGESFPGEVFKGTVAFIDPVVDPATRTVNVRYDLPNPDGRLRPGMYLTVTLKTAVADTPRFRTRPFMARSSGPHVRHASMTVDEQKVCPVTQAKLGSMGDPIAVDVEDQKVWVCCPGCPPKLKADPTKYLVKLVPQPAPASAVLTVPESAVIDTGDQKVVYVETQPGVFEGRPLILGPRVGDRYPVVEGLSAGERVAAAGSFLIDAESRLNSGVGAVHSHGTVQSHGNEASHRDDGPRERAPARSSDGHVH